MMQQNRDRNGRPRNPRPYDLNRDVVRTSAPSQLSLIHISEPTRPY